jgi:hypothetical protein
MRLRVAVQQQQRRALPAGALQRTPSRVIGRFEAFQHGRFCARARPANKQ